MEACLNHTYSNNIAAYCKLHRCGLTVKQIKSRQCLCKQCWHLCKNEDHDWWRQREVIKQRKKEKRNMEGRVCV